MSTKDACFPGHKLQSSSKITGRNYQPKVTNYPLDGWHQPRGIAKRDLLSEDALQTGCVMQWAKTATKKLFQPQLFKYSEFEHQPV